MPAALDLEVEGELRLASRRLVDLLEAPHVAGQLV
jgi:hypothetical protein